MEDVKQNVRRILNLGLSVPALAWVHFERKWWFFFTHDEGPRGQQDTSSTFSISVVDLKKKRRKKRKRSADDLKHKQKIEREPESYFEKVI